MERKDVVCGGKRCGVCACVCGEKRCGVCACVCGEKRCGVCVVRRDVVCMCQV